MMEGRQQEEMLNQYVKPLNPSGGISNISILDLNCPQCGNDLPSEKEPVAGCRLTICTCCGYREPCN